MKAAQDDPTTWKDLGTLFTTCDPITHIDNITSIIQQMEDYLGSMAMVNYPYATDFMGPLPANPVTVACTDAIAVDP